MALINCPDCNKKISDQGCSCINCGYPISKILSNQSQVSIPDEVQEEPSETKGSNAFTYRLIAFFVLMVIIGTWYYNKSSGESNSSSDRETETLVSKPSTLAGYLNDIKTRISDN